MYYADYLYYQDKGNIFIYSKTLSRKINIFPIFLWATNYK